MMRCWLMVTVCVMVTSPYLAVLVQGDLQDLICEHTELSALGNFDPMNQTGLLPSDLNDSSVEFEFRINMTDEEPPTGPEVSLIDTGLTSMETYESISSTVAFILMPITVVLGLIGNSLSLVTLVKQKPRDTITIYLISLCVADLLVVMGAAILSIQRVISNYDNLLGIKVQKVTLVWVAAFGTAIASRVSTYITAILTLERMIAVKLPFMVKRTFLNRHPWKVVLVICIFMFLFFLPNLFRFNLSIGTNSVTNQSYLIILPNQFAKSSDVYTYLDTAAQVLTRILPMVIVLVCNLVIIVTLRASVRYRKHMVSSGVEDHKTTRLLLTISAIFLISNAPGTVSGIVAKFVDDFGFLKREHYLYRSFGAIVGFLDTLNSSVNFVIYILLGSSFRVAFFKVWGIKFCQKKRKEPMTSRSIPSTCIVHMSN